MSEEEIKDVLAAQSQTMTELLASVLKTMKENGFNNPIIKIGGLEVISEPTAPKNVFVFSLGTMKVVIDDNRTTIFEKVSIVQEMLTKLKDLDFRPDRIIYPDNADNEEEEDDSCAGMFG